MRNDPEVQRVANACQLGLPKTPVAGRSGELLGRGTGSSLEFQEFREYMPGDDIRHLDWAAYARSDTLMVRLYREEISPRTEILLDGSRSMNTGNGQKARVAVQLASLFAILCGHVGGRPSVSLLNDEQPIRKYEIRELDDLAAKPFEGLRTLADLMGDHAFPLKRQSVRIVISDFLFPHDPDSLIRQLASEASTLWIVQLLSAWEADPEPIGGRRFIDVETNAETDLVVDRTMIANYKRRLTHLQEELARSCRRVHAPYVALTADRGLEALCRDELTAAEILRPA